MNDLESTIEMLKLEALKNAEVKNDETIFRQKYEKTARELDSAKKRLQQQHEDDMEQLVAMKKQLEKKVFKSKICIFHKVCVLIIISKIFR